MKKQLTYTFEELVQEIVVMEIGEEKTWGLHNSLGDTIMMGAKIIEEFNTKLVILGAYGGGYNLVVWIESMKNEDEVNEFLEREYRGCKFDGWYEKE